MHTYTRICPHACLPQMETRTFGTVLGSGTPGLLDLTERVVADPALDWLGILPYVRERIVTYKERVHGLPMQASVDGLFFRCERWVVAVRKGSWS